VSDPASTLASLVRVTERAPAFTCIDLAPTPSGGVRARFRARAGVVEARAEPGSGAAGASIAFERCTVRYCVTSPAALAPHRDAIAMIVAAVGEALDAWLEARALGNPMGSVDETVSPASIAARVERWLRPGVPGPNGLRFVAVRGDDAGTWIELEGNDAARLRLRVVPRRARDVPTLEIIGTDDAAVAAWIRFALSATCPSHAAVPPPAVERSWFVRDSASGDAPEVSVVLNGPCHQACVFCSIPAKLRKSAPRDTATDDAIESVVRAAARGARRLMLTGIDPLEWPAVIELVGAARRSGVQHLRIHSPSTRLADATFFDALIAAAPHDIQLHVPVYGVTAATHDAVVQLPGAHAKVKRALAHATVRLGADAISITTVVLRENVDEIGAIFAWAAERRFKIMCQLPFPDRESPEDLFHSVSMPQSAIASALLGNEPAISPDHLLRIPGLLPCVVLNAARHHSAGALEAVRRTLADASLGRLANGFRTPDVPCPRAATCAIAERTCGRVLRAYLDKFGPDELEPLSIEDMSVQRGTPA
jgi:hypothetical protein